jgi:ketosteroid isomerase-like protein
VNVGWVWQVHPVRAAPPYGHSMDDTQETNARLRTLEDKDAIRGVLMKGWRALDEKDWDGWIDSWHPDAELLFDPWPPLSGRSEILRAVKDAETPYTSMTHYVHNTFFEIDGDRATGIGTMLFVGVPDGEQLGDHYDLGGAYTWEFVRTPDGWKVLRQRLALAWSLGTDTLGAFTAVD